MEMSHSEPAVCETQQNNQHKKHRKPVNVGTPERFISGFIGGFMTIYGLRHRAPLTAALGLLGGALLYRGASGHCMVYERLKRSTAANDDAIRHALHEGLHIERTITIDKPVQEVYAFWRKLENLPRFMRHLKSVEQIDQVRSHWVARAPAGMHLEWDAEILQESENEIISWRSRAGADVHHAGVVRFSGTDEGGTELHVKMRFSPPAGRLGAAIAKALGENPLEKISEDLRQFKQMIEFCDYESVTTKTVG